MTVEALRVAGRVSAVEMYNIGLTPAQLRQGGVRARHTDWNTPPREELGQSCNSHSRPDATSLTPCGVRLPRRLSSAFLYGAGADIRPPYRMVIVRSIH